MRSWGSIIGFILLAGVFFYILHDYGSQGKPWNWVCILFASLGALCLAGALICLISRITNGGDNDSN